MHQHVAGCLLLLALIQNVYSTLAYEKGVAFELKDTVLTATEGSCVEIKCNVLRAFNPDVGYWFWMQNASYIKDDFYGIIIYSTNTTWRPVSAEFAERVKYIGSPPTSWIDASSQKLCSVLIYDLKTSDSGNYSVRFVKPLYYNGLQNVDSDKWISVSATKLKVEENPCLITFKAPQAVPENTSITLECSTSSSCSSYPQISPPAPTNSNEYKNTTYSFTASWTQDGKVFSCQTQNNQDTCLIRNISISVEYGPKEVVAKASSENVTEGESVDLFCSGKGNPGLTFSWSRNGTSLSNKANWTIQSINASQGGQYYCTAKNEHGNQTSNININVQYRPYVDILRTSERNDITEGENITFKCIVTRSNPLPNSIELRKNGRSVMRGKSYVIERAKPEDSGDYTCLATNDVGSGQSQNSILQVHYWPRNTRISTDGAQDNKVKVDHRLTFTCNTDAYPAPWYSWYRYNKSKPSLWTLMEWKSDSTLLNVKRADEGCYFCNATNEVGKGNASMPVCIEVLFPPSGVTLSFNTEVTEGQPVKFKCTAESSPPSAFRFFKSSTTAVEHSEDMFNETTTNIFEYIFNATWTDAGDYICRARNNEGLTTSQPRNLVVKYAPKYVKVEAQPGLLVKENTSFTLNCSARSHPAVTSVTWMKVANEKNKPIRITQTSFFVKSASPSDSGLYSCMASNDIGSEQSQQVEVKVKYAPKHTKIVKGAERQEHDGTSSVLLSCSSYCYPLATQYTWYKKTADKKYEIVSDHQNFTVTSQESGEYHCIAKNELGQRTSDPVVVFNDRMKTWKVVLFCLLFLFIFCFVLWYRYRRKKTTQQQTNTQAQHGFQVWLSRGRNPMNDAEPFRSRDDLLPQQARSPRVHQRQAAGPDTTPASNVNVVYSTVNLPQINPKPVKQHSGHTVDELNYASLHFGNKHTKEADGVYAKVSKPKAKENEQEKQGTAKPDYENVSAACAPNPQHLWESESDTSEDEVEVNYSQVNFKPKHGHQRHSSTSSTSSSSDYETQYSEVKL